VRDYDVVIVGGGVVGCAIARRLSFTTARVALVEAAEDVGEGASKGNTGIATCGADCPPGSLEAELVARSSPGWESLCASLDTPFPRARTHSDRRSSASPAPAPRAVDALLATGAAVTVVAPDGILAPMNESAAVCVHERLTPVAVRGDPGVERIECDRAVFDCDGVVLAHGLVPVRNVDGAVDGGERTVYAQPTTDPPSATASRAAGEDAAGAALALTGGQATIGPWWSSPNLPPSV
jgi:flavin-dependent dehydrogenase